MPYSYITLGQMQTELSNRLDDYSAAYWVNGELTLYIQEALRTWQSLTSMWRGRMTFNTSRPSSINLLSWSQEFEKSNGLRLPGEFVSQGWVPSDNDFPVTYTDLPVVTPDATVAPDGTMTADKISFSPTNIDSDVFQSVAPSAIKGKTFTFSIWIRSDNPGTIVFLNLGTFDGGVGTFFNVKTLTTAWQRFSITFTFPLDLSASVTPNTLYCNVESGVGNGGTVGAVISVWGAQLELGSVAGPYVPTTAQTPGLPRNLWYDLTQQTNTLIPYTLKDTDLISVILFHLIEPQLNAGNYVGSDQFILADIVQAVQRRRDQFLLETGMVTAQQVLSGPIPPQSQITLPDTVIDIRRAAWIDQNFNFSTLWKSDEWGAKSFQSSWSTTPANPPLEYATSAEPPLILQLIPPALGSGEVELIAVQTGALLGSIGTLLGVPDNFAHVVKWGALADLLGREGQPHDAMRAAYCEQRWKEGIAAARLHTSVVTAYINGVQVFPESVTSLSAYRSGWQNEVAPPDTLALMSWNLVAVIPNDANGPYSVAVDVIENAPVPVQSGDQVQISREELDAVLSYAQHLAAFKQGGQEFEESVALYQRMVDLALVRNERLRAAVPFYDVLADRARRQEIVSPRRDSVEQQ